MYTTKNHTKTSALSMLSDISKTLIQSLITAGFLNAFIIEDET